MSHYRRSHTVGAPISSRLSPVVDNQSSAMTWFVMQFVLRLSRYAQPGLIDAWVLLPDHMHCIWTLPAGDADYAARWNLIKRRVSVMCRGAYQRGEWLTASNRKHRESTHWQRRYWEHQVRDEPDFVRHVDYIHYNAVKHGHCKRVVDWPYSTFHRYVGRGYYPLDWGGVGDDVDTMVVGE